MGYAHRRTWGQFFTPTAVATWMCRWVMAPGVAEIWDPAFGLGVFWQAATALNPAITVQGWDADAAILTYFGQRYGQPPRLCLHHRDYLTSWRHQHTAIVCNPPYHRFQHFHHRERVWADFATHLHLRLSGYTNTASAFLLKSLSELAPGGRLAYLMPLEFLQTGYGRLVKSRLLADGLLKALIQLHPEKEVFPDVVTSVGLVLAARDGQSDPVRFYAAHDVADLETLWQQPPLQTVPLAHLDPEVKWLPHFAPAQGMEPPLGAGDPLPLTPLRTYGSFRRGIATGANAFFLLSPREAQARQLPPESCRRCLSKSTQVRTGVFIDADVTVLEGMDAKVWLFDGQFQGQGDPSTESAAAVAAYLAYGEAQGYHRRYLTQARTPWYKLEHRDPAPLWFGVFSRQRFKVIRNFSSALNLTCFHGFYPNAFGQDWVDHLFLYLQSRAARHLLGQQKRRYGEALDKFEPNDLNHALAPSSEWLAQLPPDQVQQAMESCRRGHGLSEELETFFDRLGFVIP
ncbi:MAG: N-6 DNA methylase [Synechococcales cyanobacterium]